MHITQCMHINAMLYRLVCDNYNCISTSRFKSLQDAKLRVGLSHRNYVWIQILVWKSILYKKLFKKILEPGRWKRCPNSLKNGTRTTKLNVLWESTSWAVQLLLAHTQQKFQSPCITKFLRPKMPFQLSNEVHWSSCKTNMVKAW